MNRLLQGFDSLSIRNYRYLWLGNLLSLFPFQMSQVARGWLAYDLGDAALAIAVVSLGWGIPQLILAPVGGVLADKLPKRTVLSFTQVTLGLCAIATGLLVSLSAIEIWHLFVLGVVQGAAFTFNLPARQSYFASLVGKEQLTNAVALNNTGANFTRIVGPSLAGALIAWPLFGLAGVFYVAGAFNLGAFLLLQVIDNPGRPEASAQKQSAWESMTAGFRYIWSSPLMLTLMSLAFFPLVVSSAYIQLMPVLAKDVFDVGPGGLGIMLTFSGIGAIIGSLTAAYLASTARKSLVQLASGSAFGVMIAVFGEAPSFPLALGALVLLGVASSIFMAMNSSLILLATPKALYGRVMAVYGLTFALMPVVQVPIAALADTIGAPNALAVCGLAVTAFVVGVTLLNPAYRKARLGAPDGEPGRAREVPAPSA